MQLHRSATHAPNPQTERARDWNQSRPPQRRDGEIVVVDGYGVTVRVQRGHLIIHDGVGRQRRERRYSRATSRIARLIILGGSGSVSIEAIRWLTSHGAALACIDRDGTLLATTTPTRPEAKLRRAQALAPFNDSGLEIAKALLRIKVEGQSQVAAELDPPGDATHVFQRSLEAIDAADTVQETVTAESEAALAYWGCWAGVTVDFPRADQRRVPEHWRRFGARTSPLGYGPRLAINPAGAILNYLYALLEVEARLACLAVGLDPALAVVHADVQGRDSLPLDLMEAIRPDVDRYLLNLLRNRVFRHSDFHENQRGSCRLVIPLTHELAQTLPTWRKLIAPVTEHVASLLMKGQPRPEGFATPLTGTNRRADRARRHNRQIKALTVKPPRPEKTCRRCGGRVPNQRRVYCDNCLPHVQRERYEAFAAAGQAAREHRLQTGEKPSHGGQAAARRGAKVRQRLLEAYAWSAANPDPPDPAVFTREILPKIKTLPLSTLARATGLTKGYVSRIRRGETVPHPKHWAALRALHHEQHEPD